MIDKKEIRIEYDQANAHMSDGDKYGQVQACVYLKDGTFLSAKTSKQGHGFIYARIPFEYIEELRRYDWDAGENTGELSGSIVQRRA